MYDEIEILSDTLLRIKLLDFGYEPGPITNTTRFLYERKLAHYLDSEISLSNAKLEKESFKQKSTLSCTFEEVPIKIYSPILEEYLNDKLSLSIDTSIHQCETLFLKYYDLRLQPHSQKCIKTIHNMRKTYFNYLLLDPRRLNCLSLMCEQIKVAPHRFLQKHPLYEKPYMRRFVESIFYIGKGTQSRPYSHLQKAKLKILNKKCFLQKFSTHDKKDCDLNKDEFIKEIWASGYGVVSLHIFNNAYSMEALTRESAMLDAIGLQNLKNQRKSSYYGECKDWSYEKKCQFGTLLLSKALQIYMCEGERQIRPQDL